MFLLKLVGAHQHGKAAVVLVLAAFKYAKYRLFCMRRNYVNGEVCALTTSKLDEDPDHDDGDGLRSSCAKLHDAEFKICAACRCPLWVRFGEDDHQIQLSECGCVIHYKCLVDISQKQHGITLPEGLDPGHFLKVIQRVLGLASIMVPTLQCPHCQALNTSWRRLEEKCSVVKAVVPGTAAAAALRRGDALCLAALQQLLLACRESKDGSCAPELQRWSRAARSEKALRSLLKEEGSAANEELSALFELAQEPRPVIDTLVTARLQRDAADCMTKTHNANACDPEMLQKRYSEFLMVG
mmetsp:Transcript_66736/g.123297  ORF Transcript_66736/g.123297 Transcript_66736/m.123297 type:complete len:298 (+) Transcript_66736:20-913(+)